MKKIFIVLILIAFIGVYADETFARAGGGGRGGFGGRSSTYGSRGSRTYNLPVRPSNPSQNNFQNQQSRQQEPIPPFTAPQPSPFGGFMRSLGGGLLGGFIGSLLFRGMGFGSGFGAPGGGIGLIEIILIGLGIFIVYRILKARRETSTAMPPDNYQQDYSFRRAEEISTGSVFTTDNLNDGMANIRQFEPSFDENKFRETATDIFFRIQAAWMNRDMEAVRQILAQDIFEAMNSDVTKMKAEGRINRLENIAMRNVTITEAWQEAGRDYITVEITANVLDYTTDEAGKVMEGSKTEPVRFKEYWTFTRNIGAAGWLLSAIQQE